MLTPWLPLLPPPPPTPHPLAPCLQAHGGAPHAADRHGALALHVQHQAPAGAVSGRAGRSAYADNSTKPDCVLHTKPKTLLIKPVAMRPPPLLQGRPAQPGAVPQQVHQERAHPV